MLNLATPSPHSLQQYNVDFLQNLQAWAFAFLFWYLLSSSLEYSRQCGIGFVCFSICVFFNSNRLKNCDLLSNFGSPFA